MLSTNVSILIILLGLGLAYLDTKVSVIDSFIGLCLGYTSLWLINFIFNYLGDLESSEDVVQETMIKLYQKKHYYKEIAKFSTWLYTIAKNLANTELRKRKQRKTTLLSQFSKDDKTYDLPSNDPEPGQEIQTDIVNKIIRDAVDQLSEKFKIVIVLRDIQGLSYEDISEIINVPIGTVKSRINRARLQLQVELKHLKNRSIYRNESL